MHHQLAHHSEQSREFIYNLDCYTIFGTAASVCFERRQDIRACK
jgi:hypothetical protein